MKKTTAPSSIKVIIPALNEAASIGQVLDEIPKMVTEVVVVDNGSTDATAKIAQQHGATVLKENRKGYGYACLCGLAYLDKNPPEIVVFLDGDYSDFPADLSSIVAPLINEKKDFVVGARVAAHRSAGALTPQQIFGNALACWLMKLLYGGTFTDLGPFRAIKWNTLKDLKMRDTTYGWTVEMQLKVLHKKIPYCEVPVRYRNRIGHSKVSGTVKGTLLAGYKILGWITTFYFSKKR
jgi:glycosyltransferase involved in cell wall biosynthesis